MPNKQQTLEQIRQSGIVAILRFEQSDMLVDVAAALNEGGVRHIEVTMTVPGAIKVIRSAIARLGDDVSIGVGTVLEEADAEAAIDAGARYVVSPAVIPEVIECCNERGIPVFPGAMTPTEVWQAWQLGADVVKVFPASVAGPRFFKDLKGPFPQVELMPTGNVDAESAREYFRHGAFAVGIGGAIVTAAMVEQKDFAAITSGARQWVELAAQARG